MAGEKGKRKRSGFGQVCILRLDTHAPSITVFSILVPGFLDIGTRRNERTNQRINELEQDLTQQVYPPIPSSVSPSPSRPSRPILQTPLFPQPSNRPSQISCPLHLRHIQ